MGNMNAITYKEVFPLIKDNKMWPGYDFNKTMEFIMPDDYELKGKGYIDENGKKHGFVPAICWYTNLDVKKRHEPLDLRGTYYSPEKYPKYDNYDAIEVGRVSDIPCDYFEEIGVPITFLSKYNPDQFELIGADFDLANPEPLPNGKTGTGRFYVRERESKAYVLTLGHSKEEVTSVLVEEYGYHPDALTYVSGIMGVPITFLKNYNPEQFEILGMCENLDLYGLKTRVYTADECHQRYFELFGKKGTYDLNAAGVLNGKKVYQRILIKRRISYEN